MAESGYRRVLSWVLLAISTLLCGTAFCGTYNGGTGTEADPYLISSPADLAEFSSSSGDWSSCFRLTTNISAASYTPVTLFTGIFDGGGHSITDLSYFVDGGYYAGFFCRVEGYGAMVKDLTIVAPNINVPGKQYVGAIAGRLRYGTISGCTVVAGTIRTHSYSGGITGYNFGGSIINCTSSASVTGNARVGGITGANDQYSYVNGCIAQGSVTASEDYCGGVVGENLGEVVASGSSGSVNGISYAGGLVGANGQNGAPGTIARSFALGQTKATSYVGGLVGRNLAGTISDSYAMGAVIPTNPPAGGLVGKNESNGTISRCYSTGNVSQLGSTFGGLVGQNVAGSSAIVASFWDTLTSGQTISAGGTGKTTDLMQQVATYTVAGWDFFGESANGTADKWRLCQDGMDYPGLSWEWPKADMACPDGVEFVDFAMLAASWGQTAAGLKGDLDNSGTVDVTDLAIFVQYWLTGLDSGLPM